MIDTIKVISMIDQNVYQRIKESSDIKTAYNEKSGQIFYTIINGHIEGKYNSSISVRVGKGKKYNFFNMYYIEIEGSYHKFLNGYNSHNGFYNIQALVISLIKIVESAYNIHLPNFKHWFLQRVDIAKCYNLDNQDNVKQYINNISLCNYPKRKLKYFENESIYISGYSTTIKIYNKLLEFQKNDFANFKNTDFDLCNYISKIQGYIRFECEIKKRKLSYIYKKDYIRVNQIYYNDLEKVWKKEFEKFLKLIDTQFNIIQEREEVRHRLEQVYSSIRAKHLFDFYILILARGISAIKADTDKSSYYKNISDLKKCGIDFSQTLEKVENKFINNYLNFNPFKSEEIL